MHGPILRIELEGVKQTLAHHLGTHNQELSDMIIAELDAQLTEEWIQKEIHETVKNVIQHSIHNLVNDYNLRLTITAAVSDAVVKIVQGDKKNG